MQNNHNGIFDRNPTRALQYYQECKNASQVCRAYGIDPKTLRSWLRLYEKTGTLNHQVKGGNAARIDRRQPTDYLDKHPDAYQYETAKHLGCTASNINHLLKVMGIIRKKKDHDLQRTKSRTSKSLSASTRPIRPGLPSRLFGRNGI